MGSNHHALPPRCFSLKVLITDADTAMTNTARMHLPRTVHRHCLWHVMKNLRKHCNCALKDKANCYFGKLPLLQAHLFRSFRCFRGRSYLSTFSTHPGTERRYTVFFSLRTWPSSFYPRNTLYSRIPLHALYPPSFSRHVGKHGRRSCASLAAPNANSTSKANSWSEMCACSSDRSWVGYAGLRRRNSSGR